MRMSEEKNENLQKARKIAESLYPDEKWVKHNELIFVAQSRLPNSKSQHEVFEKELCMSAIAVKHGHAVYMLPEKCAGKSADVVMDGVLTEYKAVSGGENAVSHRFRDGLKQGKNAFLSIEKDIAVSRVRQILRGVLKDKSADGVVYCYFCTTDTFHTWQMKDLK